MNPLGPRIIDLGLFTDLDNRLLDLLAELEPNDWHRPTVCAKWTVKDIASHILDTSCRRLSMGRDHHSARPPAEALTSHDAILRYIHRLNAEWTAATERLSPRVLLEFLRIALPQSAKFLASLNPMETGLGVLWAGEQTSRNWMDVSREYTERWHHQQQIALAVGRSSGITARRLYYPALETFLRALPFTLRDVHRPRGTTMRVSIIGDSGGDWCAHQRGEGWVLSEECPAAASATANVPQDDAWLMFTKRWDRPTKMSRFPGVRVEGDQELGLKIWDMVSIMA
ncbi:MAG: maleylpyruvate isomerase family mycothiol-dependent enzyme [Phycisphaerae bacterium]